MSNDRRLSSYVSLRDSLVVVLLGPPGSGKGTQAKRLTVEYHIPHISTGDLFRENIALNTELGQKAKGFIQAGELVPNSLVLDMLFDRIKKPDCAKGYLLDGFPRTLAQAEALANFLDTTTLILVLSLEVPDKVIIKRAEGRLVCKQCGLIYNRDISPPVYEGICDQCKGEVYRRPDDAVEVVKERLKVYHVQTQPLIQYYTQKNILKRFNGDQPPDVVHAELKRFIDDMIGGRYSSFELTI